MDSYVTENRPETCSNLGLDCRTCVRHAASSVASICQTIESQGLFQIFLSMYPSAGCHPMALTFEAEYQEATAPESLPALVAVASASLANAAAAAA